MERREQDILWRNNTFMKLNSHYSVHASTVTLPHASEPRLSTYVPYLWTGHRTFMSNTDAGQPWQNTTRLLEALRLKTRVYRHTFIVTLPFVTLRMLKPTVGIMSSLKCPDCRRKTRTTSTIITYTLARTQQWHLSNLLHYCLCQHKNLEKKTQNKNIWIITIIIKIII